MFSKLALILMGILALALVATGVVEEIRIHNLNSDLSTANASLKTTQASLTTSQNNVSVLKAQLARQSAAIDKAKADQKAIDDTANAAALAALKKKRAILPGSGPAVMNSLMKELYQ